MAMLSVPQAAERLGVSAARVRQRIEEGSLVAEKVGGRWLVDIEASSAPAPQRGRPVSPSSVWWSLLSADMARALADDHVHERLQAAQDASGSSASGSSWAAHLTEALAPRMDFADVVFSHPSARDSIEKAALPDMSALSKAALPGMSAFSKAALPDMSALSKALVPALDSLAKAMRLAREPLLSDISAAVLPLRMNFADAILAAQQSEVAEASQPDLRLGDMVFELKRLSPSSRHRIVRRFVAAVEANDHEAMLEWLRRRADRRLYRAADRDLEALRHDERLLLSGVSHPDSQMQDPRIVEGYVQDLDLSLLVEDHWLDDLKVGERPNIILHVAPVCPSSVSPLMLAADLAEHGGPRELHRAHEILNDEIRELLQAVSEQEFEA